MKKLFATIINRHKPLLLFHAVFVVVLLLNFPFGKYFLGWDSISPEFNFPLNFHRAFFSSWIENYGTGALTGHGFAALFPHTLITFLLSILLPQSAIRSAFIFLMYYLGGLGMYALSRFLLQDMVRRRQLNSMQNHLSSISLLASFFYLFNLGTVQIFYAELEPFIVHFAALPWLFYLLILLLKKATPKRIALFSITSFLASVQGFIPSLFAAYLIATVILLIVFVIKQQTRMRATKKAVGILLLIFLTNIYWMSSLIVYQITQNGAFLKAYNNLTSTQHFIEINRQYGGILNTMLLKGYLFSSFQLGDYILTPWIRHLQLLLPTLIGYGFFLIILSGLYYAIRRNRNWLMMGFGLIFLFFFASLATNAFPFSYLTSLLQIISPTYAQAFRTAFTKFSIGASFSYSIFFSIGLFGLIHAFSEKLTAKHVQSLLIGIGSLLIFSAFPIFQGNLLYNKLEITLPQAYKDVMTFFHDEPNGRIADFPQDCSDGWYAYKWGYFGSGFYWYGLKQPVLSRSFDVWGQSNESYYWEISQALHAENFAKLTSILDKYNVRYVLYDPNVYYCNSQKSILVHQSLVQYLKESPDFSLIKTAQSKGVSPILIFQNKHVPEINNDISLQQTAGNIRPEINWTDNDTAYKNEGTYLTDSTMAPDAYYPFRAMFTKRGESVESINITSNKDSISLRTMIPKNLSGYHLKIDPYKKIETIVPVTLSIDKSTSNSAGRVTLSLSLPVLMLDGKKLLDHNASIYIGDITNTNNNITLLVNGEKAVEQTSEGRYDGMFFTSIVNSVDIIDEKKTVLLHWDSQNEPAITTLFNQEEVVTVPTYSKGELTVTIPKHNAGDAYGSNISDQLGEVNPIACNEIVPSKRNIFEEKPGPNPELVLSSRLGSQCANFSLPKLLTSIGYLIDIKSSNVSGDSLKFQMYQNARTVFGPIQLPKEKAVTESYYLLPPNQQNGLGYDVQFINTSESSTTSVNTLTHISLWALPLSFLEDLHFSTDEDLYPTVHVPSWIPTNHPNETLYSIQLPPGTNQGTLISLYQAFHTGWKAYEVQKSGSKLREFTNQFFPFFTGKEVEKHVKINNWANGWILPANQRSDGQAELVIIFLPQYVTYLGFLLTAGTLLLLPLRWLLSRKNNL